jgi:hypothetical protein
VSRRSPPIRVLADMARAGVTPPLDADFLGTRLSGGDRIVVYRRGEGGEVIELRCPLWNVNVAARRRSLKLVK